jgi:hypothetical protein
LLASIFVPATSVCVPASDKLAVSIRRSSSGSNSSRELMQDLDRNQRRRDAAREFTNETVRRRLMMRLSADKPEGATQQAPPPERKQYFQSPGGEFARV